MSRQKCLLGSRCNVGRHKRKLLPFLNNSAKACLLLDYCDLRLRLAA